MKKKTIGQIKREAREKLKGNWGISVSVVLIYLAITTIAIGIVKNINSLLGSIATIVIVYPLSFGLYRFFYKQRIGNTNISNLFSSFKNKNWIQAIIVQVVLIIGMIISIIPFIILIFLRISSFIVQQDMNSIGFMPPQPVDLTSMMTGNIIWFVISLIFLIPLIIYSYTYSQVLMVAVHNDKSLNIKNIFKTSRKIMKGNKWRLFVFQISYIGWFILGVLALLIGSLWSIAYFIQGNVEFFNQIHEEYLISNKKESEEAVNDEFYEIDINKDTYSDEV